MPAKPQEWQRWAPQGACHADRRLTHVARSSALTTVQAVPPSDLPMRLADAVQLVLDTLCGIRGPT